LSERYVLLRFVFLFSSRPASSHSHSSVFTPEERLRERYVLLRSVFGPREGAASRYGNQSSVSGTVGQARQKPIASLNGFHAPTGNPFCGTESRGREGGGGGVSSPKVEPQCP
jgi:hypothetical protein